ncbi:glycosyltransferase family protein [Paenibacillus sp. BR2-3]
MLYEESAAYIRSLTVPDGYEIELISIEGASSMTAGYNEAMRRSDAKYKVYLHQDVFIIHSHFIYDMLSLFRNNANIGMLGVIGARTIPANGIWWESGDKVGKVYDSHQGNMQLILAHEVSREYGMVQVVDGLLMVTQYDLPWREDLFQGWHFYDVSQCMEFAKAGYAVAVPKQEKPWCLHDSGIAKTGLAFAVARKLFCHTYLNSK